MTISGTSGNARSSRAVAYCERREISRFRSSKRKATAYRSRKVGTGDALNGSIEVVESLGLDNLGADLRPDAEGWETSLDGDKTVRPHGQ